MFFNEKLMSSESIGKVWRAAYHRNIETDSETCLPKICQELDGLIDNVSNKSRKRLSLRTSAVLVDGTAKLHRQELQRLYGDVIKLDHDLIHHRKRPASNDTENITESSNTSSSSQSLQTPEKMMRQSDKHAVSLNNSLVNIQNSTSQTEPRHSSNSGSNRQTKSGVRSTISQPTSPEDSLNLSLHMPEATEINKHNTNTSKDDKRNQETQTTITASVDGIDSNNLPFGFVIMFDSSGSRYPKRIICSSLKKNVESTFK